MSVPANETDASPALLAQRIDRFNDGLLQVGAHGMEESGRGVDVDEDAVGKRLMQRGQVFARQGRGTQRDETGILVARIDQGAHVGEERQAHHIFDSALAQRLAHIGKIGITRAGRGVEVFQHRNRLGDARTRGAQRVAEFVGNLDHAVAGRLFRGEAGVTR